MATPPINLQDTFLNIARTQNIPVTVQVSRQKGFHELKSPAVHTPLGIVPI